MLTNLKRWIGSYPGWTLAVVTVLALAPFLARPFNVDDPLFVWTAKQIVAHPANPYGFQVNWYGEMQPMWSVTENPPLAAYYLALAGAIFGWGEIGLHLAFLLPAIAAVLGTYRLARRACDRPLFAALLALFMPVFLLSSATLMCDVPMLAFWVWAIAFWIEGSESRAKLWFAAMLVSLAALTKYFGACLIPLLAAYTLFSKRRLSFELAFLAVPLVILGVYEWATKAMYGYALLSEAAKYASFAQGAIGMSRGETSLIALSFCGGCLAVVTIFSPWLWRGRTLAIFAVAAVALSALVAKLFAVRYSWMEGSARTLAEAEMVFWIAGGISALVLAIKDFRRHRDAVACLLFLWISGTFVFAAVFNWTVNGRSLLPMAPAAAILIVRALETSSVQRSYLGRDIIGFGLAAALAVVVTWSDFATACAVRQTAMQIGARYPDHHDRFYFEGHWGFQYYMEAQGIRALDVNRSALKPGDTVVIPVDNSGLVSVDPAAVVRFEQVEASGPSGVAAMSTYAAAGFYSSVRGPLPFAFGKVPDQIVCICQLGTNAASALKK